ncbi:MAG TPA: Asp-tRNA(Asn)/Glu-tRNA(Gln) amidotransferase subunit GatB [Chitinophagales bacterium]|nr:Asp-tRNA(Asn)/Glu-tRNA(Gln) amidotransferase subunit GatB [Chitinophagales bacterium]
MTVYDKYEWVIGLEVHAQLNTRTKIFAADEASFGAAPNAHISPITLGLPGVLPRLNRAVLEKAIRMGIACHCNISEVNHFARKNYFYADLPKGYQISQDKLPICLGGYVSIEVDGKQRDIRLTRIHMEEDAGKNNHELDPDFSLIDLNRAGVPLIEIVSEPDIHTSEEAYAYLTEIRKLVRFLDICDGNMEEGSLRCDANVSVRLKGDTKLNTRVEVKNMNSIRNVKRAIEIEARRQIDIMESGGEVEQETRSFNQADGTSFTLRSKEHAHDYRYFPEPDLPPVIIRQDTIEAIRAKMPMLPKELAEQFMREYQLPAYDAHVLTDDKEIADYYQELVQHTAHYKAAANWVMGEIKSYLNEHHLTYADFTVRPKQIATILALLHQDKINSNAAKTIFHKMAEGDPQSAQEIAESNNLLQSSDSNELEAWVQQALATMPDKVAEYKKGKKGNLNLFMGIVMKISKGKADPKLTTALLEKLLNQ